MNVIRHITSKNSDADMHTGSGNYLVCLPAPVAQLDACPTGDQEVVGSTPAKVGNILSWRLIMKYFLRSFSPFR